MSRTFNNRKKAEGRQRKLEREEAKKREEEEKLKAEEDAYWAIGAKTSTKHDLKLQKENERLERKKALQKLYEEEYNSL